MAKQTSQNPPEDLDFNIVSLGDNFDPMSLQNEAPKDEDEDEDEEEETDTPTDEDEDEDEEEEAQKPPKQDKAKKPVSIDDQTYDELILNKFGKGKKPKDAKSADDDQETDDEDAVDKKKVVLDDTSLFTAHYKAMVAKGLWQEDEAFDGTEESYVRVLEQNREADRDAIYEEIIEEAFEKNPSGAQKGKALLRHLANGGSVDDFVELHRGAVNPADLDAEDEAVANDAARELLQDYWQRTGMSAEKIKDRLKRMDKLGTLVDEAKDIAPERDALIARQQKESDQRLKAQKEQRRKEDLALISGLNQTLDQNPTFAGQPLFKDKKERAALEAYIFQPADDNTKQSALVQEINRALRDPKALPYLAHIFRSGLLQAPEKLQNPKKVEAKVKAGLEKTLEAALQNKPISSKSKSDHQQEPKSSKSKLKFNYDEFEVLS